MTPEINPTFLDLVKIWADEKKYGTLMDHRFSDMEEPWKSGHGADWIDLFEGPKRKPGGWYLSIWYDGVIIGTTFSGPKQIAETVYYDKITISDPKFFDSLEVLIAEMKLKCRR